MIGSGICVGVSLCSRGNRSFTYISLKFVVAMKNISIDKEGTHTFVFLEWYDMQPLRLEEGYRIDLLIVSFIDIEFHL